MTVWHSPGPGTNPRGTLPLIASSHNLSAILFDATASKAAIKAASQQRALPPSSQRAAQTTQRQIAAFPTKPFTEIDERLLSESSAERGRALKHKEQPAASKAAMN